MALGTIPGWLTLITILAIAWAMIRGGTGTAVAGLQDTNRELVRQIEERKVKELVLEKENAELRGAKDVTVAILPVLIALEKHEDRAAERSVKTLKILDLIAERLGPESS